LIALGFLSPQKLTALIIWFTTGSSFKVKKYTVTVIACPAQLII
jgi:hypothetical protein